MKLDAEVKFNEPFPGTSIDINEIYFIPVDSDYVHADEDELYEWISNELYKKFNHTFSDREFTVKNFWDLLDELDALNDNANN